MGTTEPEVEDERGMGWPDWKAQKGVPDPLEDPCGAGPIQAVSDDEEAA